jgi:hypothetical protein
VSDAKRLPWDFPLCNTNSWPSLWLGRVEREAFFARLCGWHLDKLREIETAMEDVAAAMKEHRKLKSSRLRGRP